MPSRGKYPIYVLSKGRHDVCMTANFLIKDKVDFKLIVEPQEADLYAEKYGRDRLHVLPFSNLGLGSIPARNWCWEHAKAAGFKRHWVLDDNIMGVWRRYKALKIRCDSLIAFKACEDFIDRYENVAVAGLNYYMFAVNGVKMPPFYLNVHVYSFLLIDNEIPQRWRGRYNEDTDLCLQVLSAGYCTVLFNAFLAWKQTTMKTKGGNTAELYKGDGRLKMARSLKRQWPHVVEVKRRFNRPQHVVHDAWKKFDTPLKRRADVDFAALAKKDEKGFKLVQVKDEIKSPDLRRIFEDAKKQGEPT